MGAFLDKPITEKSLERHETDGLRAYSCSMQGWRVSMEDAHIIKMRMEDNETTGFYGVFDGHGGVYTSESCREQLLGSILSEPEYKGKETTVEDYKVAIRNGFFKMDRNLRSKLNDNHLDHSGSTAITAFVTEDNFIVANCGDSRCVLSRGGKAVALSSDHKPNLSEEQDRICEAGGIVMAGRVNGELAVSRALGDFLYKTQELLPPHKQMVSAEPDIRVIPRDPTDDYLLFACDGIWDAIPDPQDCVDILNELLKACGSVEDALKQFLDVCLEKNSRDNMTVVIVIFDHNISKIPSGEEQKGEDDTVMSLESLHSPMSSDSDTVKNEHELSTE